MLLWPAMCLGMEMVSMGAMRMTIVAMSRIGMTFVAMHLHIVYVNYGDTS